MIQLEFAVYAILSLHTIWSYSSKLSVLSFVPVVKPVPNSHHPHHRHRRSAAYSGFGTFLWTTTNNNNNDNNNIDSAHPETDHTFQWEYGCTSCAGTDPDRPTKVNQDGSFFVPPMSVRAVDPTPQQPLPYRITIFGVMDGHGKKGHEVVHFLQQQLPKRVQEYVERALQSHTIHLENVTTQTIPVASVVNGVKHTHNNETFSLEEQKIELISIGHADPLELFHSDASTMDDNVNSIAAAIVDAFIHTQYDLRQNPNVPSSRSGTTCICCVLVEDKHRHQLTLYTANVGDSRAIMITALSKNKEVWNIQTLTNATTVNLQMERNRIERCKESRIDTNGNVFYGPIGIAMTRSLGNSVMLRAGIVPIPIITKQNLPLPVLSSHTWNDTGNINDSLTYYLCAGTDGIFDVLSNEKVTNWMKDGITKRCLLQEITTNICHAAKLAWLADLPIETKVDDCTMAILKISKAPITKN
jgi:serine/threonine protein phosphatase PrpC